MLFLSASGPYDPDEPEGGAKRSAYTSRKDVVIIVCVLLALSPLAYMWWKQQKTMGDKSMCLQNVKEIGKAMQLYALENSDRLPPSYYVADAEGSPSVTTSKFLPITWASLISPKMSKRQDFLCKVAAADEKVETASMRPGEVSFPLSYGMYKGLSAVPMISIPNPGQSVLVAETANQGAGQTYDPRPFGMGQADGFLIGWNDSNTEFTKNTQFVTRLAFYKTADGDFGSLSVVPRHKPIIHAIRADGHAAPLVETDAVVEHDGPRLRGAWWADPTLFR